MNQLSQSKKIIVAITVLIIIIGVIVALTAGFKIELKYRKTQEIALDIEKDVEIEDIKQIARDILGNDIMVQRLEKETGNVSITAEEITEEQREEIVNKVNEKYEVELDIDAIEIKNIPPIHIKDMLLEVFTPFLVTSVVILAYFMVRYNKIGYAEVGIKTLLGIIISQFILFSIIAITRIPIGRLTIPMVMVVYALSIYGLASCNEAKLKELKEEKSK